MILMHSPENSPDQAKRNTTPIYNAMTVQVIMFCFYKNNIKAKKYQWMDIQSTY